jgi:hypothetical protein
MSAKAGKSSAPHCGHLLTNNLFILYFLYALALFKFLDGYTL